LLLLAPRPGTAGITIGGGGFPEPDIVTGKTVFFQDDFSTYTTATALGDFPSVWSSTDKYMAPQPSPITTSQPVDTANDSVISPGWTAGTKALQMLYDGADQTSRDFVLIRPDASTTPNNKTYYVQFYARVTLDPGWNLATDQLCVKFCELWPADGGNDRAQTNTRYGTGGYSPPVPVTFEILAGGGEVDNCAAQPVTPWPYVLFDGSWFRYTIQYTPPSSDGASDGIMLAWANGTNILNLSLATVGVTPSGGAKAWCTLPEVQTLNANGLAFVLFGGPQTTPVPNPTSSWAFAVSTCLITHDP